MIESSLEKIIKFIEKLQRQNITYKKNIYKSIEMDNNLEWELVHYIRQYFINMKENVIFLYPYDKNINYVDHVPFIFYYDYKGE